MSLNLYAYCQGNSIKYTDPSGHIIELDSKLTDGSGEKLEFVEVVAIGLAAYKSFMEKS